MDNYAGIAGNSLRPVGMPPYREDPHRAEGGPGRRHANRSCHELRRTLVGSITDGRVTNYLSN